MSLLSQIEKRKQPVAPEKIANFIVLTNNLVLEKSFIGELGPEVIEEVTNFSSLAISILSEEAVLFKTLESASKNNSNLYVHMLTTAIFGYLVAKNSGFTQDSFLLKVFIAGLLHDIGLDTLDDFDLNKSSILWSKEEESKFKSHPKVAMKLLNDLPGVPEEVILAVYQHHECNDGTGFPQGLKRKKISPISQIISCVDIIDDHWGVNETLTKKRYLGAIKSLSKIEKKKYNKKYLNSFIKILNQC